MLIKISGVDYNVESIIEKISIADSFVVQINKIGRGHGEGKLYIKSTEASNFDYTQEHFECFLLKSDLLWYIEKSKNEYVGPIQLYTNTQTERIAYWENLKVNVSSFPMEQINFRLSRTQVEGNRFYLNSDDDNYQLIRKIALPKISYLTILKLKSSNDLTPKYYFRLFLESIADVSNHLYSFINRNASETALQLVREEMIKVRVGQNKFREALLQKLFSCPITGIDNQNLLIASHIKPWSVSSNKEKLDPYNGLLLSPTIDKLFDRGFITFSDDKKIILSNYISSENYKRLGLLNGTIYPKLPVKNRFKYLAYHRKEVFLGQ